jgi:hypothetical protein
MWHVTCTPSGVQVDLERQAMENKPEGKVEYTVCRAQSGQWDVNEKGFEKPIASFADQQAAVEYANRLAATKTDASVQVH